MFYKVCRQPVAVRDIDDPRKAGVNITTPIQFLLFDILQELRRLRRGMIAADLMKEEQIHHGSDHGHNRDAQGKRPDSSEQRGGGS